MVSFRLNFVASPELGLGHYSRSRILANALVQFGSVELNWANANGELPDKLLGDQKYSISTSPELTYAEVEVFDGPAFTPADFKKVRAAGSRCVVIDDFGQGAYEADLVLCHQPGISGDAYQLPALGRAIIGPKIALIDPIFYSARRARDETTAHKIFVSFGAADRLNMAQLTARALTKRGNLELIVLAGPYSDLTELNALLGPSITVMRNASAAEIAHAIQVCDAGLVSASTVAMECCAAALPVLTFATTSDQFMAEQRLSAAGFTASGGNAQAQDPMSLTCIIRGFIDDRSCWPKLVAACEGAFEPVGCARAAIAINDCRSH